MSIASPPAGSPEAGETDAPVASGHVNPQCLNCGAPLSGPFCASCGQKAELHRTIRALLHDLLHGALHFEGKIWHTLPLLTWKPGALTRRYIEGERAKFVSPMALFLFSVFLMFAVFQALGVTTPTSVPPSNMGQAISEVREQAESEREAAEQALAQIPTDGPGRADAEQRLTDANAALAGLDRVPVLDFNDSTSEFSATEFGLGWADEVLLSKWRENPGLMLYKLQANSYKFSWLLIPLSIPFVWLLFLWRRQFRAYDHAVFVTYSLGFMTLLFVVLSVLGALGATGGWLLLAFVIVAPLHIYKQLRGTYSLSRFSAAWRLVMLTMFILIILTLFLQALLVLGAF